MFPDALTQFQPVRCAARGETSTTGHCMPLAVVSLCCPARNLSWRMSISLKFRNPAIHGWQAEFLSDSCRFGSTPW
jgi:hypothetical protein